MGGAEDSREAAAPVDRVAPTGDQHRPRRARPPRPRDRHGVEDDAGHHERQSATLRQPTAKPSSTSMPTPRAKTFPSTIHDTL